ncbi:MAG: 16S rRNA (cytidine(1402)-2'-O)-methyltransferase [Pseudomonadota bacterium]|nr:16S rRNA (cytidine(1402)-2'-O)-methyltransferase [Pseudomonadota bacterium]
MNISKGILFVVATPIGNADDISLRAKKVLENVKLIAAEDTRRTGNLLKHLGISNQLLSCHEHNESKRIPTLLGILGEGGDIALVSDAGTPVINDPGYKLVCEVIEAGYQVIPIPGCSAAIAAVSVAGLPTDKLFFLGFLPNVSKKRLDKLSEFKKSSATLIIYEAPHRILATLKDVEAIFGPDRLMMAAREITKLYESYYRGTVREVRDQIVADTGGKKGEFTLVVGGVKSVEVDYANIDQALSVLLRYLGVRQASEVTAELLGIKKNLAYKRALEIRESSDETY